MAPFSPSPARRGSVSPVTVGRYNGLGAYEIQGATAAGRSTGEAMDRMEKLAANIGALPSRGAGCLTRAAVERPGAYLYAISLLVVFLCSPRCMRAGRYRARCCWSCARIVRRGAAVWLRGLENDVYFQVGLLTHGPGREERHPDRGIRGAGGEKGCIPARCRVDGRAAAAAAHPHDVARLHLWCVAAGVSTGAGAQSRIAIGTAVIGGMTTGTLLAIFFVPLLFVGVRNLAHRLSRHPGPIRT